MMLYHGDCLEVMREMPDASVDAIVTDPPYGLSFMGKDWDKGVPGEAFWREALRVSKPGAHMLAFGGTRTYHRLATAIEDAGWEIRDCIMWVYGSGFPKSHNIGKAIDKIQGNEREEYEVPIAYPDSECWGIPNNNKRGNNWGVVAVDDKGKGKGLGKGGMTLRTKGSSEWEGWGTALKPAVEPIVLARKPLSEKTIAANVLEHGTGGLNIDGCRVGQEQRTNKYAGTVNYKTAIAREGETMVQGRWPANIIHDGSEEVVALFPVTKSGARKGGDPMKKGRFEGETGAWGLKTGGSCESSEGSAARFFYCAKASKAERDMGDINNNHPTVKPLALMRYLCRLITPPDGVVLDPFCGSGSSGCAAIMEGFNFIGIELDADYYAIAQARIHAAIDKHESKLF